MAKHKLYETRNYYYLINGGMPGRSPSTEYDVQRGNKVDIVDSIESEITSHIAPELDLVDEFREEYGSTRSIADRLDDGTLWSDIALDLGCQLRIDLDDPTPERSEAYYSIRLACDCPSGWVISASIWVDYREMVNAAYGGDEFIVPADIAETAAGS